MATVTNDAELAAAIAADASQIVVETGKYANPQNLTFQHRCQLILEGGVTFTGGGLWFAAGSAGSHIHCVPGGIVRVTDGTTKAGLYLQDDDLRVTGQPYVFSDVTPEIPGVWIGAKDNISVCEGSGSCLSEGFKWGLLASTTLSNSIIEDFTARNTHSEHGGYINGFDNLILRRFRCEVAHVHGLKLQTSASTPGNSRSILLEDIYLEAGQVAFNINQAQGGIYGFEGVNVRNIEIVNQPGGFGGIYPAMNLEYVTGGMIQGFKQTGYVRDWDRLGCKRFPIMADWREV